MDRSDIASRRRTLDIPAKPESGLAEWTTKIKALQRQVDEDEETEQKRLEAEIAASRAARLRRSTGGRGNSVDLSKSEIANVLTHHEANSGSTTNDLQGGRDGQGDRTDAFKRLTGQNQGSSSANMNSNSSMAKPKPTSTVPVSLAAFMGGRATGPRLTRHAPQQDAHDPTQFEQRTHITAPHPVFGKGGIAMPGMTGRGGALAAKNGSASAMTDLERHDVSNARPMQESERDRTTSTPSAVRFAVDKAEEQRVPPEKAIGSSQVGWQRQRTISTPTGSHPAKTAPLPQYDKLHEKPRPDRLSPKPVSHSTPSASLEASRSTTPQGRDTPVHNLEPGRALRSSSTSPLPRTPPNVQSSPTPVTAASGSPKSPSFTPSLARPIQPTPRQILQSRLAPASPNPSPAFLRPPPPKDPTPSISRLQGRGFVQNMVRASSQLEASATSPGSPSSSPSIGSGRKATVLDRWQFNNQSSPTLGSPGSPPINSPKPIAMRKSRTADPFVTSSTASDPASPTFAPPKVVKHDYTGKSQRSVASHASIQPTHTSGPRSTSGRSEAGAGGSPSSSGGKAPLGSSSTMISYIKPLKTGDDPATSAPPSRPPSRARSAAPRSRPGTPEFDELGIRVRTRTKSLGNASMAAEAMSEGPPGQHVTGAVAVEGKPLSHPTKDRARKPRKARDANKEASRIIDQTPLGDAASKTNMHAASVASSIRVQPSSSATSAPASRPQGSPSSAIFSSTPSPPSTSKLNPQIPRGTSAAAAILPNTRCQMDGAPLPATEPRELSRRPVVKVESQPNYPASLSLAASKTAQVQDGEKSPITPSRKNRIPSTGNRAKVMDVAQALNEHEYHIRQTSGDIAVSPAEEPKREADPAFKTFQDSTDDEHVKPDVKSVVPSWGTRNGGAPQDSAQIEKRKSSFERYSAFVMPSLREEHTPAQSPAGTLSRAAAPQVVAAPVEKSEDVQKVTEVQTEPETRPTVPHTEEQPPVTAESPYIHLEYIDEPLPKVNVGAMLRSCNPTYEPDPDITTVSVDVLSIVGNSATPINRDTHVFYDSELLVIVQRAKAKSSGLVATKVWCWRGKQSRVGDREGHKLQELGRRYNTSVISVQQYGEPAELVSILGGQLVIRQGTRAHWSSENTSMHITRCVNGVVHIDELDPSIKCLCSGFSYCLSLLGTFYVWYGCGSTAGERQAALVYARSLTSDSANVIELAEGESDDDEMFWLVLGEREYAKADYWKWRSSAAPSSPRMWPIDAQKVKEQVPQPIFSASSMVSSLKGSVYVVDCTWEYFVLVGREARGRRQDIKLAMSIAMEMSSSTAALRPFTPTVHVLVLPSQLPCDLRLNFRDLDEFTVNEGNIPDHMNLISASDALYQLEQKIWDKALLKDPDMLPLGLHTSHLGH